MVSGIINADDFIAAVKLDRVRDAVIVRFWATAFVLLGAALFASRDNQAMGFAFLVLGLVGWSFELYFTYLYLPRRVRKRIVDVPEMQSETSYEWDDETLHVWNSTTDARRPWKHFKGVKEDDSLLLLYVADNLYHVIPKRWIEDAEVLTKLRVLANGTRT